MANTRIISPKRFRSRRWESTPFWSKAIERNPSRAHDYDIDADDGLTDEQLVEEYQYFKAHDMVMPETRQEASRLRFEFRKTDRRTRTISAARWEREMMARVREKLK